MVRLEAGAHIGHGAVIHGARIGRNALIGMNAVVMDRATVGAGCIVGALAFVPSDMQIPERKVAVGNPARVTRNVSDAMLAWKTEGTALYQTLPGRFRESLVPCEPLREVPPDARQQDAVFETWHERRTAVKPVIASASREPVRLKNYVCGEWVEGTGRATDLFHAVTGEKVGEASTGGIDFEGMVAYARTVGGPRSVR